MPGFKRQESREHRTTPLFWIFPKTSLVLSLTSIDSRRNGERSRKPVRNFLPRVIILVIIIIFIIIIMILLLLLLLLLMVMVIAIVVVVVVVLLLLLLLLLLLIINDDDNNSNNNDDNTSNVAPGRLDAERLFAGRIPSLGVQWRWRFILVSCARSHSRGQVWIRKLDFLDKKRPMYSI